jgi:T5orf172 domain
MTEIVYLLTNEAMPGLVKVGRTSADLAGRIKQLFQTGVPLPFELFFACEVADGTFVEGQLHDAFGDHRVSRNREFFRIAPERVQAALSLTSKREIQLGDDEVFETPEDKADVVAAKRRVRFQFSMIGMKPGTVLVLAKDPSITCTTVDERNRVEFQGAVTTLSDAAVKAYAILGQGAQAMSGPWAWTCEGQRLDDIRREKEEAAD